jgi:hypothetical protein
MKTVEQIVRYVSGQLQDQRHRAEYTRWTVVMLIDYLNDALSEISGIRPEAFALRETITLAPGYIQAVPVGWMAIVRVEENPDGTRVYEGDTELMRIYGGSPRTQRINYDADGNVVYLVRSFSIDPKDPKTYYVSPGVPAGVTAKVLVTMIANPVVYTPNDMGAEVDVQPGVYNLIQDYMLGRAFEIDTESAQARANSTQHFTQFYQFFGLNYKQSSAFRSGNYMGSTAAGNPAGGGA